jgi:hypothetical protein
MLTAQTRANTRPRSGFARYGRLVWRTYFPGRNSPARLTPYRFLIMTAFLPVLFAVQALHGIGFLLDNLLFRGYRDLEIRQPLFIVGVPRSGTTFLHRLIARDDRFTTTSLWELIFAPSITEKYFWIGLARFDACFGRPLARLLDFAQDRILGPLDDVHSTRLGDPEEDYLAMVPIAACFLLTLPFPFEDELWHLAYFDDETPPADKTRILTFYKRIIQRHLYVYGANKQYLSKNPSFTSVVGGLMDTFPDCRIIGCVRTPYKAVPSLLSGMITGAEIFGNDQQGHTYRDQLCAMMRHYYHHLIHRLPDLPDERHAYVRMEDLAREPKATVAQIYERFGWNPGETYLETLSEERARNKQYKSTHQYTLDQFRLTPESLHEDFRFAFDHFGFKPDA